MITVIFNGDGTRTVIDDGAPDDPPDELAALRAKIASLEAATITIAQRATPMSKTEAEALVKAPAAVTKG